jgi:hypothetical protein
MRRWVTAGQPLPRLATTCWVLGPPFPWLVLLPPGRSCEDTQCRQWGPLRQQVVQEGAVFQRWLDDPVAPCSKVPAAANMAGAVWGVWSQDQQACCN